MMAIECYDEPMKNRNLFYLLALAVAAVVGVLLGQTGSEPTSPPPPSPQVPMNGR